MRWSNTEEVSFVAGEWKKGKVTKLNSGRGRRTGERERKEEGNKRSLFKEESLSKTEVSTAPSWYQTDPIVISSRFLIKFSIRFLSLSLLLECYSLSGNFHRSVSPFFGGPSCRVPTGFYLNSVTDAELFASFVFQRKCRGDARATAETKALFHFLFRWPRYCVQRVNCVTAMRATARAREREREKRKRKKRR